MSRIDKTYTPNSWGRTRRPKQLYEHLPRSGKQGPSKVEVVDPSDLRADLADSTEGENGYSTENQQFLHVFLKDLTQSPAGVKEVHLYAYNYAFAEWAPLELHLGNATSTAAVAETGASGDRRMYVFDVSGVDRVAFCHHPTGSTSTAPSRVRAACSTF